MLVRVTDIEEKNERVLIYGDILPENGWADGQRSVHSHSSHTQIKIR